MKVMIDSMYARSPIELLIDYELGPEYLTLRTCVACEPHPGGKLVAMAFRDLDPGVEGRCGVWSSESGGLAWDCVGTSIAWASRGEELLVLRSAGRDDSSRVLERRSWPGLSLVEARPIDCPGEHVNIACSPLDPLVVIGWGGMDECGYEVIEFAEGAPRRRREPRTTAKIAPCPRFSPDGRFLVWCIGPDHAWWCGGADSDLASEGGLYCVGSVSVEDVASAKAIEHDIMVEVPEGYFPDGMESFIWGPRFVEADAFEVDLPNGETRRFRLSSMLE